MANAIATKLVSTFTDDEFKKVAKEEIIKLKEKNQVKARAVIEKAYTLQLLQESSFIICCFLGICVTEDNRTFAKNLPKVRFF